MSVGDFGVECENCECLVCTQNDDAICKNCSKCDGNTSYSKWKMGCKKLVQCSEPEDTIEVVLGSIIKS